ncbi:MAG: response regulator [Thermoanaerobaculia bacterium]
MKEKKISFLLVEDDEVDIMNVKRAFEKNKITNPLHIARDGLEALEILKRKPKIENFPNVVLLDLRMPKMDGIEFLKNIRADSELKKLIIIVLTTSDDDRDVVSAYDFNVAGYIIKPITFDKFMQAMATINLYWTLSKVP